MASHPPYMSEEDICNLIQSKPKELLWLNEGSRVFREFQLGFKHRCDFLVFEPYQLRNELKVVEVKQHADVYAISQLCEYVEYVQFNLSLLQLNSDQYKEFLVQGVLVAKTFDTFSLTLAKATHTELIRLFIKNDQTIESETFIYPFDCNVDRGLCEEIKSFNRGKTNGAHPFN